MRIGAPLWVTRSLDLVTRLIFDGPRLIINFLFVKERVCVPHTLLTRLFIKRFVFRHSYFFQLCIRFIIIN